MKINGFVTSFIKKNPKLKRRLKYLYYFLNYHLSPKKPKAICNYNYKTVEEGDTFFGYYDKSPLNKTEEYLIYQSYQEENPESVNLMLTELKSGEVNRVAKSTAFNWQQGTKLQWLSDDVFIYNQIDENGKLISESYNIKTKAKSKYSYPIYDCYNDEFALSLSFQRLTQVGSHYGYSALKGKKSDLFDYANDGLFYLDLKSNKLKLLVSFAKIQTFFDHDLRKYRQKINHIMISPDGVKCIFIYRYFLEGERIDNLFSYNLKTDELKLLIKEEMVSHLNWLNDITLVGYFSCKNEKNYYYLDTETEKISQVSDKLAGFPDGHPVIINDDLYFDTYPDKQRVQHLYKFNIKNNDLKEVASFISPLKYFEENRCDLHPKRCFTDNYLFLDTTYKGHRSLVQIDLTKKK